MVSHLEEQIGPFDEQELKMKWAAGEILPIDYVYDDEKEDWVLLVEKFPWAAGQSDPAPRAKTEGGGPPPVREDTILRRPSRELVTKLAAAKSTQATSEPVRTESLRIEPIRTELKEPPAAKIGPAKVKLINGVGEIDINPPGPGQMELVVQDSTSSTLIKTPEPVKVHVKALKPAKIEWTVPTQQTVGQDLKIEIRAVDERGNLCNHFNGSVAVQVRGSMPKEVTANIENGQAQVVFNHTKAENWELNLHCHEPHDFQTPSPCKLEWLPGPAARLILDAPKEYLAGNPMKVQVKAVDAYGNIARTFHGTVVLEVKAS